MPASRRRPQPAKALLTQANWSINSAAREIDVPHGHLFACLHGVARPSAEVRERLPRLLGVPLDELFEPDRLAFGYSGPRPGNVKQGLR